VNTPLADYIITHTALAGRPGAGPAIALSLMLVAFVCALTGLCYAELASMIPIAGSAYTYTYATMGELIAWIIGWDLILEYAGSNMTVSVGFAAHVVDLLDWFGLHPSAYGSRPPICLKACRIWPETGFTIPAGTSASTFRRFSSCSSSR
jgi:APA family basic amino acid/polyamine antiporter